MLLFEANHCCILFFTILTVPFGASFANYLGKTRVYTNHLKRVSSVLERMSKMGIFICIHKKMERKKREREREIERDI